jgi:hypothetical protein
MNSRTLVWMTHSFRQNSRLTDSLSGQCSFVYYSPYHFAGKRERDIYKKCSKRNLTAFYSSINSFELILEKSISGKVHIYRVSDPVSHINALVKAHGFTNVVIDQPLFAMWHTVDISKIDCDVDVIDSDLIDVGCVNLTAKSRWTSHIKQIKTFVPHVFSKNITAFDIPGYSGESYPTVPTPPLLNVDDVVARAVDIAPKYGETRNQHDGQTRLSVPLHYGVIDPANIFFTIANLFVDVIPDMSDTSGPHVALLRQFAFREISIIQSRRANMTLENTPLEWAKALMHHSAYDNLVAAKPVPGSKVDHNAIRKAYIGDADLDFLLTKLLATGIMPNRARMYYASRLFYLSATGPQALENIINTFDLIGLDGQSPNNYTQSIGALGLSYGKVLKMNREKAFELLKY